MGKDWLGRTCPSNRYWRLREEWEEGGRNIMCTGLAEEVEAGGCGR